MYTRVFSIPRVLPTATAATIMTLVFGLSYVATSRSRMTQTSSVTSQTSNAATGGNLAVLGTDARDKTIRFGDELVVLITLQNQGTKPIRIPLNALMLKNEKWIQGSGWGSGLGE